MGKNVTGNAVLKGNKYRVKSEALDVDITFVSDGCMSERHDITKFGRLDQADDVVVLGTYALYDLSVIPNNVDHPDHYNKHPYGIEAIDVCQHMSFNLGNAVKYIWRADHKGNGKQDLEKALWYIKKEIERVYESTDKEN